MAVANEYDTEAATYDKTRFDTPDGKIIDKLEKRLIETEFMKLYKKNKPLKVLDVGCGTGRLLNHLSSFDPKLYGIDPSKKMRQIAKRKVPKAKIVNGSAEKIPFKSTQFDFVFCMHVFMHLSNFKNGIQEMHRVLKRGGTLIADFPNRYSPWTILSILLNPFKKRTRLFTIEQLKKELKNYNLQIGGLFSYSRIFYKIPMITYVILILEDYFPLPIPLRRQIMVKIQKFK